MAILFVFCTFILAAIVGEIYGQDIFMKRQINSFMKEATNFDKMYLNSPVITKVLYNNIQIDESDYKEFLLEMRDKAIKVSEKYNKINPKYFKIIEEDLLDIVINIECDVETIIQVIESIIKKNGW